MLNKAKFTMRDENFICDVCKQETIVLIVYVLNMLI